MLRRNPIVLAVGLVLLAAGCAADVEDAYRSRVPVPVAPEPAAPPAPPAAPAVDEPLVITGAGYDLHSAGPVGQAAFDGAWAGALATLNRYLEAGVLTPLRSGGPAGDLGPLFTAGAASRVASPGPDRDAFVDEGLPAATGIRRHAGVATLSALAGSDGTVSVVTAQLDLRLTAEVDGGPVAIARSGELVLMPEGGSWKIDAYDLRVTRESAQAAGTTTTVHLP